jgi:outer membrane protein assembly factor BamD
MTVFHLRRLGAGLLMASLVLVGCSTKPKEPPAAAQQQGSASGSSIPPGVEQLYADAKDDMNAGAWESAIKSLERVEGRAAGTILAQQAQIDLAYAYWRSGERAQALARSTASSSSTRRARRWTTRCTCAA